MYEGMSKLARNLGIEIEFLNHTSRGLYIKYYKRADQVASATSGNIVHDILNGGFRAENIMADPAFGELLGLTRDKIIIP